MHQNAQISWNSFFAESQIGHYDLDRSEDYPSRRDSEYPVKGLANRIQARCRRLYPERPTVGLQA